MSNTAIDRYIDAPLGERHQYAQALASAGDLIPRGLFGPPEGGKPPAPSVGKVLLVIETGAMLGIHPIAALSSINVIEGKPAASAALMSAILRGAGHKLRLKETGTIETGDYAVTGTLIRADDPDEPFTATWTPQRAARAGMCTYAASDSGVWAVKARSSKGHPLPWESYTEALCKARVVSELGRDGGQDALLGVRYTPEELGATVSASGDVIEGELEDEPAAPSAMPAPAKRATNGRQGTKRPKPQPEPEQAPEPQPAPEPDSNIVDAEVVNDEPATVDPDSVDRSDEAAVRAYNETHGKASGHLITSYAEREAQAKRLKGEADEAAAERAAATDALVAQAKADGAATRAKRAADEAAAADAEIAKADAKTGAIPIDDGEAAVAEIKAKRAARGAPTGEPVTAETPEPWAEDGEPEQAPIDAYEVTVAAEPGAWAKHLEAAQTIDQVKQVWQNSQKAGELDTALKGLIILRRSAIESA